MENIDSKIDSLIDILKLERKTDKYGDFFYLTTEGKIYQRHELRKLIRETLGIDEQCCVCNQYFFRYEMSDVEKSKKKICQDCLSKVMKGELLINEDIYD